MAEQQKRHVMQSCNEDLQLIVKYNYLRFATSVPSLGKPYYIAKKRVTNHGEEKQGRNWYLS